MIYLPFMWEHYTPEMRDFLTFVFFRKHFWKMAEAENNKTVLDEISKMLAEMINITPRN